MKLANISASGTLFGAIEAGGTKWNCMVASDPQHIRAEERFETARPGETLQKVISFFRRFQDESGDRLSAIGVACFGPVDLDTNSPSYGHITSTPKPGWANTNVAGAIKQGLGLPVAFDTDVNGAAVGEAVWGAAQGLSDFLYLTIGTGVGGGGIVNSKPVHGLIHPEMGHMRLPHDWDEDPYKGFCLYHGDCFEGLASGPAISDRWGIKGEGLPPDHPAWELEAHYIALALHNLICTFSPQRIILGGGVMEQHHLFPRIRTNVQEYLNSYVRSPALFDEIDEYIVPPGLGKQAGVMGALALARQTKQPD
ncbi:MAG: ROK family protein [Anaerolineaceae bacterium]